MSSTVSACLATNFKVKGINYSITSACSTSAHCIGAAAQQIAWGMQDVMFAGGGEELSWGMSLLFDGMGCKAFAAGYAACIDQFTSCENFSSDFLTDCIFRRSRQTQFSDKLNRRYASFVKMAFHRFGGMFFFNFTKTKLNSVITVCFFGFVLKYYARTSFYNSYRNQLAVSFKNLGHAQFFA